MFGKVAVTGLSLILVIGVSLAVVAVVNKKDDSEAATENLSPQMRLVAAICSSTDHQKECQNTLSKIAHNSSSDDPREYIKAAILATAEEIRKGYNLTDTLVVDLARSKGNMTKMSIDSCKEFLELASDSLQASYSRVEEPDMHTNEEYINDIQTWLSAVISLQQSCLDELGDADPILKQEMKRGLDAADKLTSNSLAIFDAVIKLLNNLDLQSKVQPSGRGLLETTEEVGSHGLPTWLSRSERKLLEATGGSRQVKPNSIVAQDGSGQFKTIAAALAAYEPPKGKKEKYIIYVKAGIYEEYINVTKNMINIFMYGDGPRKTIVTGHKSNAANFTTSLTATFSVIGWGFLCKSMGFQNTAGPEGHQAVALRVQSDRSAFYDCRIDAHQDTLYAQANRQFYRNCDIYGTVDFIFGDSTTIIQNSKIIVRRPMEGQQNMVTASGRKDNKENSGLVIHNCRIMPEKKLFAERFKFKTYLGRPWKEYARTVVMESTLGDFIQPAGYSPWNNSDFALDTCEYLEYGNIGAGANTEKRVKWKGVRVIGRDEATNFTAWPLLNGKSWLRGTGGVFFMGLKNR